MANFQLHPDYDALPEPLKMIYGAEAFAWLGDVERNRIIERECYPEPESDE